ncbi:asparagine synthase-related protein [Roseovarius spongiae]|nr:asparagine synthase-related protein [Roseovarius spongiae]
MTAPPEHETAPYLGLSWRDGAAQMRGRAHWRSDGQAELGQVGRLWARWDWDGARLSAEVDPFGFFNLFLYEKEGEIALSPSLLELVAQGCDAAPDPLALAVFHRMGIFIHDETPLRHVRTLPPGARVTWERGKLRITGGVPVPQEQQISREAAVEGMTHHFRTAMARILEKWDAPLILPLSGGRDSRHILLEMLRQGRRPGACVTFHHNGAAMNAEALAARAVAERAGIRHNVLGHARPRLADAIRALVMTDLCAEEHAQMMPLHDYVLDRGGAAFDGIAGDILTNPDNDAEQFYRLAQAGDFIGIASGLVEGHGRVISQPGWGRGAGPLWSPGRDEEVVEHIGRAVAAYADAPDPYQVFWMYHRTRREINFVPQAILGKAEIVFCPYLDPDFARFCMSLPYTVTRDQMLHDDVIARAYPDYADIPFAEGFAAPPPRGGSLTHKLRSARDVLSLTRAFGNVPGGARALMGEPAKLRRGPDMMYRLHAAAMEGLDAARARHLLDLAAALERARPKRLISDAL